MALSRAEITRRYREKNPEKCRAMCRDYFARIKGYAPPDPTGPTLPELVEKQAGRCAICQREKRLVLDHCHKTGKIRGGLCTRCNNTVGTIENEPGFVTRVLEYLEAS